MPSTRIYLPLQLSRATPVRNEPVTFADGQRIKCGLKASLLVPSGVGIEVHSSLVQVNTFCRSLISVSSLPVPVCPAL
jgi:hypothetical protein